MERQRKLLVAEFQREKQKMITLDQKMREVQKGNGLTCSQYTEPDDTVRFYSALLWRQHVCGAEIESSVYSH